MFSFAAGDVRGGKPPEICCRAAVDPPIPAPAKMLEPGRKPSLRQVALALAAGVVALLAWWLVASISAPTDSASGRTAMTATHIGSQACATCHQSQFLAWQGSDHELAMQPISTTTVLAPFRGERFTEAGVTSTFSQRDGKFYVRTEGADGRVHQFEIAFALGVRPLQQYLIRMADGGMQTLGIAWDSRQRERGGQRWFHLQAGKDIKAGNELHWTGRQSNWNFMCAECHTTQFKKNFNASTRTFASTWSEVKVACEACHGPGSEHVVWARKAPNQPHPVDLNKGLALQLDDRGGASWTISAETGNAIRSKPPADFGKEVETCARCHSHRSQISDDYVHGKPLLDTHVPSLLEDGLYWRDGQMRAEVFNYASFMQSRMQQKGVTCSDCHDPHSLQLRVPGDQVCRQCHAPTKYEAATHHFHTPESAGARCVGCHMPATTYMTVDLRHDHSMRVPRPDLSPRLGTPNACNKCHADKSSQWAAQSAKRWYPSLQQRRLPLAEALHAGDNADSAATRMLLEVLNDPQQPAIVRASALARLPDDMSRAGLERISALLGDTDPLLRRTAVEALASANAGLRARLLARLLDDPVKGVRIAAARWLAGAPTRELDSSRKAKLNLIISEYIAVQQFNADRPEAYNNLGTLYADQGDLRKAEEALLKALEIDPRLAISSLNLADVCRELGREADAQSLIRGVIGRDPSLAPAHHALGLSLLRQKRTTEALRPLQEAIRLAPGNSRYAYVYAVTLEYSGHRRQATKVLETSLARHPEDRESLRAVITFCRRLADAACVERYGRRLSQVESTLATAAPSSIDHPSQRAP